MGREFSAALSLDELYRLMHRQVSRVFDASSFYIATFVEGSDEWTLALRLEEGQPGELGTHQLGEGFTSHILRTRAPLLLRSQEETSDFHRQHGLITVGNPAKSWMGIPLIAAGELVGVMAVQSYQTDNLYSPQDLALFTTIGVQAATAIQNARLVDQMQQALQETQSLYQASAALNAAHDYSQLLETLRQYTVLGQADVLAEVQVFDAPWAAGRRPRWNAIPARWSKLPEGAWPSRYDLSKLEMASLWQPNAPLIIQDIRADERLSEPVRQLYVRAYQGQSLIYAPLVVGGQWIGNVTGLWSQPRLFAEDEVRRLLVLAGQAAIVAQSLVQLQETRARAQELAALNDLSQTLASRLSVNQVLEDVYRGVSRLLDVANFFIALYDPYRNQVSFPIDVNESVLDKEITVMPADRGITGYIIRTKSSVLISDKVADWLKEKGMEHVGEPSLSWLGVPMLLGEQVLGVIALQSYTTPRKFGEHERDLLTAIASQAAIAIQNARLFEDAQARARREQTLRQITARVRGAPDPDLIVRTAVRELSSALGRPAFVRLGSAQDLAHPPASAPGAPGGAPIGAGQSTAGQGGR
jgi:GAF domain-containing protein